MIAGLACAIWWLAHPYVGLSHDALFYAAEALWRGGMAPLGTDPFFSHGSQGDFSVFIAPYAAIIRHLDPAAAALVLTLGAKLAWLWSLWTLCRAVVPAAAAVAASAVAWAAVLVLPPYYEPFFVFSYGESFTTPRIFAEILGMFALAAAMRDRPVVAWVSALAGAALHPLMGLSVLAMVFAFGHAGHVAPEKRWRRPLALCAVGVVAVLALALADVAPADRLLQRYDDAWWQIVNERNFAVLVQQWDFSELARTAGWCLLLGLGAQRHARHTAGRRLGLSALVVVGACLILWLIGSWSRDVLLVQLQLWRALWLAQVIAPLLWVTSFDHPRRWSHAEQAIAALVAAAMVSTTWNALVLAVLVAVLMWPGRPVDRVIAPDRQRQIAWLCGGLVVVAKLAAGPDLQYLAARTTDQFARLPAVFTDPALWLLVGAGLVAWLARRGGSPKPARLPSRAWGWGGGGLAACGLVAWLLPAWALAAPTPAWILSLRQSVPPGSTVYWQQPLPTTWIQLRRASYADNAQGASALFSRPQALELQQRLQRLKGLGLAEGPEVWPGEPVRVDLDATKARQLCQDPALDVVIARGSVAGAGHRLQLDARHEVSMFDCALLRTQAGKEGV